MDPTPGDRVEVDLRHSWMDYLASHLRGFVVEHAMPYDDCYLVEFDQPMPGRFYEPCETDRRRWVRKWRATKLSILDLMAEAAQ